MGKTPGQIVLPWRVQSGRVAVPKSVDDRRQKENLDVFSFSLTQEQMDASPSVDTGSGPRLDSDEFRH